MVSIMRLKEAMSLGGLSARELLIRTWKHIGDNEILTRAAGVSFYAMLAFIPFLALIVMIAVQLLPDISGSSTNRAGVGNLTVEQFEQILKAYFPDEAYEVVESQLSRMQTEPPFGLISIGLIIALWTASSLFLAIIDSMNRIYGVHETRPFWKLRLTAIFMTIIQAFVLISSLLVIVAWPQTVRWFGLTTQTAILGEIVQFLVVYIMILMSFALTFFVGPDADQRWEWITPGSLAGTAVFLASTYLFRVYIQNFTHYNETYGSLGGVMILLFWFWISSVVLLCSGQINKIIEDASPLGKNYGQKVEATNAPDFSKMPPEPQSNPQA